MQQLHALQAAAHRPSAQGGEDGFQPIQRVLVFTKEGTSLSPDAVYDRDRYSREGIAFVTAYGEDALRAFIRQNDGKTYSNRNNFLSVLKKTAKAGDYVPAIQGQPVTTRNGAIAQEINAAAGAWAGWFESAALDHFLYKMYLIRTAARDPLLVRHLYRNLRAVSQLIQRGLVERGGVAKTLSTFAAGAGWTGDPADYSAGEDAERVMGLYTTVEGVVAELETVIHAASQTLDTDEVVFNASVYEDADDASIFEDVDVSYIGADGILHLIEVAKDVGALANKLMGGNLKNSPPSGQKQRYQHLADRSQSLVHRPQDPMAGPLGRNREIAQVEFSYSIPANKMQRGDPRELMGVINSLKSAGASLFVGGQFHRGDQLDTLWTQAKQRLYFL